MLYKTDLYCLCKYIKTLLTDKSPVVFHNYDLIIFELLMSKSYINSKRWKEYFESFWFVYINLLIYYNIFNHIILEIIIYFTKTKR